MINSLSVSFFLLGAAAVLFIGFVGRAMARKTSIPHIVWLMLFGIAIGPVFGLLKRPVLLEFLPFVTSIVIIIVLFNAGLSINIKKIIKGVSKSVVLAITNLTLAAAATVTILYFLGYPLTTSVLIGLIVGGLSASIIPGFGSLSAYSDKIKTIINLESIIAEPLAIIFVLVFVSAFLLHDYSPGFIASKLISEFSIGIVIGAVFGLGWVPVMSHFQRYKYEYSYAGSLAIVFFLYIIVQGMQGSGPMSALVFGMFLANGEDIFKALKYRHGVSFTLSKESRSFNDLVAFLTASFFFVYFGALIFLQDYYAFAIGVAIAVSLLIARQIGTRLALLKSQFVSKDKAVISSMLTRGTGAAVAAAIPVGLGIAGSGDFIDIAASTIITTIILTVIMGKVFKQNQPQKTVKQTLRKSSV
ncbi:cation:proton antiporter [Candidatus Parvarchaeota archaeon]|nr:cation:proton antiporter [Candidatus Parvarchaeota archaeon]